MKLAESWSEEKPTSTTVADFHDEVEEQDEVDETEDGCGGVQWRQYVLKAARTSNKLLHELAREVRGVENRHCRKFTARRYRAILAKWAEASKPFLRPDYDYLTEFLAKLDCVTVPKGETLQAAFERAKRRDPPAAVLVIPNANIRLFASLCQELHEMGSGAYPIMLCQASIGKLFGVCYRTIGYWIKALKTLGVLKLAEPARKNQRAARYHYVAELKPAAEPFPTT